MKFIKEQLKQLFLSLTNEKGGFSARKLAALSCLWCAIYLAVKHVDKDTVVILTQSFLAASFLFLGIITIGNILELRNGKTTSTTETLKVEKVSETVNPS